MDGLERLLDAFARASLDEAPSCFAPDGIYQEARGVTIVGRDVIASHFAHFARSGPRWRFTVDDLLRDGPRACVVYRFAMAEGDDASWRERAGCAVVRLDAAALIAQWREYEG